MAGAVGDGAGFRADVMRRALAHRGPDAEGQWAEGDVSLAHTRLSIMDPDPRSDCPFRAGATTLVWNGELWNHETLRHVLPVTDWRTTGDTETAAAWLDAHGAASLDQLEGMFALAWHRDGRVGLARDRFGEVPLHLAPIGRVDDLGDKRNADGWLFASEMQALVAAGADPRTVEWVEPGSFVSLGRLGTGRWQATRWGWYGAPSEPRRTTLRQAGPEMRRLMENACRERGVHSDVPVCTLLSGGIDSTAVAFHLREVVPDLVAYTAVYNPKSQDARMSRLAADRLGVELREVHVPLPSREDLVDVVRRIEMPYKAQVEIAWPCLHLARRIQEDGFKVCFSGEGSDELWASYGFAYHVTRRIFGDRAYGYEDAPFDLGKEREFSAYRSRTFREQHRKNFARCNKVFMAHGVECRLPFLHTPLVEFALSIPVDVLRVRSAGKGPTKQKAVMYEAWDGLVPDEIVRRHKVAFQEGMGLKDAIAESFGSDDPKVFYNRTFKEAFA